MHTSTLLESLQYPGIWAATSMAVIASSYIYLARKSSSVPLPTSPLEQVATNPLRVRSPEGPFDMGEVRVSKLLVHPIKSCRGSSVPEVRYTPSGLENDRKWCIVDASNNAILTAREVSKLVLIEPRLRYNRSSPYGGDLIVSVPGGAWFSVPIEPTADVLRTWPIIPDCTMFGKYKIDGYVCLSLDPTLPSPSDVLSNYLGKDVHLVMKGPAIRICEPTPIFPNLKANNVFQDGYPLLVASEESLSSVGNAIREAANGSPHTGKIGGMDYDRWKDGKIEIERFRPNIVLRGAGVPFAEDAWRKISIAPTVSTSPSPGQTISLVSKCARCLLPNVDPKSGVRDAAVPYKIIMKVRTGVDPTNMSKPCFGCNGVPGGNGVVRVGDLVTVHEWLA